MSVSSDYKTFDFRDSKHKSVTGLQNCWKLMSYWSIEKMYEEIPVYQAGKGKGKASSYNTVKPSSEPVYAESEKYDASKFYVEISYGKKFKLTNADKQWISFDGQNYEHTMPIRDYKLRGNLTENIESDFWSLTLDKNPSFVFCDMDDGCQINLMINGLTYSVNASHNDTITVTENAITISGHNQSLDLWLPNENLEFTRVLANTSGDVVIELNENGSKVKTDVPLQNVRSFVTNTYDLMPTDLGGDPTEINVPYTRSDESSSVDVSLSISAPFKAKYKTSFTASVSVSDLPEGARIEWSSSAFRLEPSIDGKMCTATPITAGTGCTLTVTVYGADNEKLAENSTSVEVRYAWWQYIIFIFLFGWIWY